MDNQSSPPQIGSVERQHVPKDLMEDILLMLPVKSLVRFKCVSKTWKYLICGQQFIKKHLRNSTKNKGFPNHMVISLEGHYRDVPTKQSNLMSLLNDPSIDPSPIADDPTNKNGPDSIVGCCNGLVCIVDVLGCIFLWNPATRISEKLPIILHNGRKPLHIRNIGFGWDEFSGAYKVVTIVEVVHTPNWNILNLFPTPRWTTYYKVYSSKTNSWKVLENEELGPSLFDSTFHMHKSTLACGKLHWLENDNDNIVSFDLKNDEFGLISKPDGRIMWLGEIGGCLGAAVYDLNKSKCDVWVMKEKEESWLKLAVMCIPHLYRNSRCLLPFAIFEGPLDGELSLLFGGTFFFVYNDDDYNFIRTHQTSVYIESLVSPPRTDLGRG